MTPAPPTTATSVHDPTVFPVLDSLRFLGALAVLTTHVAFQSGEYLRNGTLGVVLSRLDVGVAIFFVLSGFLLSRPYVHRAALAEPQRSTRVYLRKRLARIMPLYVVTVLLAMALVPQNAQDGAPRWLASLLLLDSYLFAELPHGLTHMWSLTAEVTFYLLLPGLMWLMGAATGRLRPRRVAAVLLSLTVVALAWHAGLGEAIGNTTQAEPGIWLPAYLTWFAAGIAIAVVDVRVKAGDQPVWCDRVASLGRQPGVCWTLVAGLMLAASTELAGPVLVEAPTAAESLSKSLIYTAVGSVIVLTGVFAAPQGAYSRAMSWAPLRHLGHISYGIFCIHMLLLITVVYPLAGVEEFSGQGLRVWVVALVLSVIAAEILYRCVELPAMRRWGSTSTRRSAAAEATAQAPSASS